MKILQSGSKLLTHHQFCSSIKSKNSKIRFSLIVLPTAYFNPFRVSESLAMSSSILAAKREHVKVKLALDLPSKVIQKQINVSLRTVQRIYTNLKHYDSIYVPKASQQNRSHVITSEMKEIRAFDLCFIDKQN